MHRNTWQMLAAAFGLAAVIAGAVGAHALSDEHAKAMVAEATMYALVHAAVLLHATKVKGRAGVAARVLFAAGILLFSGGISARYFTGIDGFGNAAPFGGTCLMAGWLALGIAGFLDKQATQA